MTGGEGAATKTLIVNDLDQEWDHDYPNPPDFKMEQGKNDMNGKERQCSPTFYHLNKLNFLGVVHYVTNMQNRPFSI